MKIKNSYYHMLSFKEIDKIRKRILSKELSLYINTTQLYLYLNQMDEKYSFILKWVQNLNIASIVGTIIFIFLNWRVSLLLGFVFLITGMCSTRLAMKFIRKQCEEDRVFLKFALAVELVKVAKRTEPLNDPIYKAV